MATYNGEVYVHSQIESILAQLEPGDELVISDNGSTDRTIKIIQSFKSDKIKIHHCNIPNVVKNFENAIVNSCNEVIILCDQDDVWLPERVSVVLDAHKHADMVSVSFKVVDEKLAFIMNNPFMPKISFISTLIRNSFLGCSMSFKRSMLNKVLPFPDKIGMHDWWIVLNCLLYGKVVYIDKPLFLYRRHTDNVSQTTEKSPYSLWSKLRMRLVMFYYIVLRVFKNVKS